MFATRVIELGDYTGTNIRIISQYIYICKRVMVTNTCIGVMVTNIKIICEMWTVFNFNKHTVTNYKQMCYSLWVSHNQIKRCVNILNIHLHYLTNMPCLLLHVGSLSKKLFFIHFTTINKKGLQINHFNIFLWHW